MRSEHDSYKEPASTQEESTCARKLANLELALGKNNINQLLD